mmetsp:Transcript_10082/g.21818  ORF Transcript_10082/g.21818 Transcript_10082/m.21818 type:complete len:231 (-) Transcript_10082:2-694(-)
MAGRKGRSFLSPDIFRFKPPIMNLRRHNSHLGIIFLHVKLPNMIFQCIVIIIIGAHLLQPIKALPGSHPTRSPFPSLVLHGSHARHDVVFVRGLQIFLGNRVAPPLGQIVLGVNFEQGIDVISRHDCIHGRSFDGVAKSGAGIVTVVGVVVVVVSSFLGTLVEFGRAVAVVPVGGAGIVGATAGSAVVVVIGVGMAVAKVVGLEAQGLGHVGGLVAGHCVEFWRNITYLL